MGQRGIRGIAEVLMMIALTGLMAGCGGKAPAGKEALPGTLAGVYHASSGGSMVWRSEFSAEVTPQELVQCAYWPEDVAQAMVEKSHVPITAAQWADVERAVLELWPLWEPVPAGKSDPQPIPGVQVLDGGDYRIWYLTWHTDGGDVTQQYYQPSDRRITTLITLLQELADPTGREVVWYDAPVLCGVYFRSEKQDYSCQCTQWDGPDSGYRYISYYKEDGESRSVSLHTEDNVWREVCDFCAPLALEQFPAGNYQKTVTCTLYYSDGAQKCVVPDRKTARQLQGFFTGLTARVQGN